MHLAHPVTQTIYDQAAHDGVITVERVAAAGEVEILMLRVEQVVSKILKAAQRKSRTHVIALGGMIENDVEDHFDARAVQRLHHISEFIHRAERMLPRTVTAMRREEGNGIVTPIIF